MSVDVQYIDFKSSDEFLDFLSAYGGPSMKKAIENEMLCMQILDKHLTENVCKGLKAQQSLYLVANSLWKTTGNLPSVDDLVKYTNRFDIGLIPKIFTFDDPISVFKSMMKYGIEKCGIMYTPSNVDYVLEYYKIKGEFPSRREYFRYLRMLRESETVDENALPHDTDGKKHATTNLDRLVVKDFVEIKANDPSAVKNECSICRDTIKAGDKYCTLPCGHVYHHKGTDDCLGVLRWLEEHDTCPMCRAKVVLK